MKYVCISTPSGLRSPAVSTRHEADTWAADRIRTSGRRDEEVLVYAQSPHQTTCGELVGRWQKTDEMLARLPERQGRVEDVPVNSR